MPNRIIKESICTSESVDRMSWFEECFFTRLWTACDDYGRMDARPSILRAKLFPLKERITLKDIENALQKLADIGCVSLYEIDGKPYLYLPSWEVHQSIRAKRSKYPAPNSENAHEIICMQMQADDCKCPRNPIQSESESESESNPNTSRASAFDAFWVAYPKKVGKGAAEKAFSKLSPSLLPQMLSAIDAQKQSDQWKKDGGQFIPNPATWLNQRRWEDELPKPSGGFAYNADFEEGTSL